jgi:hypothetical protein
MGANEIATDQPAMRAAKKPWNKPELVVLVRGKPEEAVLAACKGYYLHEGSVHDYNNCMGGSGCPACDGIGDS